MPDWNAPHVTSWACKAKDLQDDMFLRLGDRKWDEWCKWDKTILHRKVGFGLFSLPENLPDEDNPTGYDEEQFEKIKLVSEVILRNSKSGRFICFACIFIFGIIEEDHFVLPVFKVLGDQNQTLFVDSDCRVYNNWKDYLKTNRLPKCCYCYPRDGQYQGYENRVLIDFGESPACNLSNRIWSYLDTTATVVNLASTTVLAASLLTVPIATPVIAAAQAASVSTGIYCASRSVTTIVDRHWHDQSVSLADSEARGAWLGIVGTAIGVSQSRIYANISRAAAAGDIASKALKITFNALAFGSLTLNGYGILKGFISLVHKADKGTLNLLDVYQFSISVLFFSNNLLDPATAKDIIENTQREVLNHHAENLTPRQIEELFSRFDQVPGRTPLYRNANKVKMIQNINSGPAFYGSLVTARSDEDELD